MNKKKNFISQNLLLKQINMTLVFTVNIYITGIRFLQQRASSS